METAVKAVLSAVALVVSVGAAEAAPYNFTFGNGSITFASGTLNTSDTLNSDGSVNVTSISGAIYGQPITGLLTGNYNFSYQNALFTTNADPLKSLLGLGVATALGNYNIYEAQTTGFGGTNTNPDGLYTSSTDSTQIGRFTLSAVTAAVPEPSAWGLMILGMGAIGFAMRRQKATARVSYAV